ncbi:hypothetical protein BDB00DRAFT_802413 [Zychaea mexicana]|uniref:uncharacterized protein n=1 Tax=Zychaea mexicana TaxID=64656 RepID=UPI0022FDFE43|nr:uncharacterized protein BDB00DRAFT_802413 [Zychaea mexicana]KAI9497899.1 hypothetical protein BDB00DRAFT_802413 [Zychaea mexicana]
MDYESTHQSSSSRRRGSQQDFLAGQMILPRLASYLVRNPDESPESYLLHHQHSQQQPRMNSSNKDNDNNYDDEANNNNDPSPPQQEPSASPKTRRLSVQDLCNPIESLEPTATPDQENGVDLTEDEFQALQGFGRFRLVAIASADGPTSKAAIAE